MDSLPIEVLLQIASSLTPVAFTSFCLVNKRNYNLLASTILPLLKADADKRSKFLEILIRDLPWDRYICSHCGRIHVHRYDQSKCSKNFDRGRLPYLSAARAQWDNVSVIRNKYFAESKLHKDMTRSVSTSYTCTHHALGSWGYTELRPNKDGKLYVRSQTWLRWEHGKWGAFGDFVTDPYRDYYCIHAGQSPRFDWIFGEFWHATWEDLRTMSLSELKMNTLPWHTPTKLAPVPKYELPEHWISTPMHSCRLCRTETIAHFGITPVKSGGKHEDNDDRLYYAGGSLSDYAGHIRMSFPPRNPLKKWGTKLSTWSFDRSEPPYWCDTMVITTWMCIGGVQANDDGDWIRRKAGHGSLYSYDSLLEYEPGSIKAAFDGQSDKYYHPMEAIPVDALPKWKCIEGDRKTVMGPRRKYPKPVHLVV